MNTLKQWPLAFSKIVARKPEMKPHKPHTVENIAMFERDDAE